MAEHDFSDLAYKDSSCQPYHWSLTKKQKEKERKKNSKHFCKQLLGILVGFLSVA